MIEEFNSINIIKQKEIWRLFLRAEHDSLNILRRA